jgi:hypothetical protein
LLYYKGIFQVIFLLFKISKRLGTWVTNLASDCKQTTIVVSRVVF